MGEYNIQYHKDDDWTPQSSRMLPWKGRKMMNAILVMAGVSILFFGYDQGVMSQVNLNADYKRRMGIIGPDDARNALVEGFIVAIYYVGFCVGALLGGKIGDRIGRIKTAVLGCAWAMVGAVLQASAANLVWMCSARVVSGIGVGHLNTIIPIWSSEITDANVRGAFLAFEFFLGVGGATFAFWFEYLLAKTHDNFLAWRFPLGFQLVFLAFVMIAINFFPESPRWLAKAGRMKEAKYVLECCSAHPTPEKIEEEMNQITTLLDMERESAANSSYLSMLVVKDRWNTRRRAALAIGAQLIQKITGIDFITTYAPQIFALAGFPGQLPTLLAGGDFVVYTFSLLIAVYLIDRAGRRALMLWGSFLMGLFLAVAAALDYFVLAYSKSGEFPNPERAKIFGIATAAVIFIYTSIFGSTWITAGWLYPTEIFPLATRAKGAALSCFAFGIGNGAVVMVVPYLIEAVGLYIFVIFAVCNFLSVPVVYFFYPETANRSLEEIDILFTSKSIIVQKTEKEFQERLLPFHKFTTSYDTISTFLTSVLTVLSLFLPSPLLSLIFDQVFVLK